jgi:lambda family phage portal protein
MASLTLLDLGPARAAEQERQKLTPKPQPVIRRRNFFSAADQSRLTADWIRTSINSADQELWTDLRLMRGRSRELGRNSWVGARFLQIVATNVIGKPGITPWIRIPKKRGGGAINEVLSDSIEDAFRKWSRPEYCSADGKLSWRGAQRLAIRTEAQDGEYIIQKVYPKDNPFAFALKFIDADQMDHTFFIERLPNGNEIRMGVEINPDGKPVGYYVWNHHPSEWTSIPKERKRIPAEDVVHAHLLNRIGATRGFPWMAPAMFDTNMLRGYQEAEVTAARTAAAKMGFFTSETGEEYTGEKVNDDGSVAIEAQAGTFETLPAGMSFTAWDPQHPNGNMGGFMKTVLRNVASALGVSYHNLANDLEGVNYSSGRLGELADRDVWRELQAHTVESFCCPIFKDWLRMAVLSGQISLGGYSFDDVIDSMEWKARGWDWVDPYKDTQAKVLGIQNGLETITSVLAEQGRDIEDVVEERKTEVEMFKAAGVTVGTDAKGQADTASDNQQSTASSGQ